MSRAEPIVKNVYKAGYSPEDLQAALDEVWAHTQRLRTQSAAWNKNMITFVLRSAKKYNVLPQTLKNRFRGRLDDASSGTIAIEKKSAQQKKKADARGQFTGIEMKVLYDWIEFMRQQYLPPRRSELRYQVWCRVCLNYISDETI